MDDDKKIVIDLSEEDFNFDDMILPQKPEPRRVSRNPRKGLMGISPNEQGRIKREKVLKWLYVWHKTSSMIIKMILGTKQGDFLSRMEVHGLVHKVLAPGLPIGHVWMLTKDGLAMAIQVSGELYDYDWRPNSIDFADLRHDLAVQLAALKFKTFLDVKPERLLGGDAAGQKRPDAVVNYESTARGEEGEYKCAIEVELTHKKGRELDQALLAAAKLIEQFEVGDVRYVSPSLPLLNNYRGVLAQPINCWEKNDVAKKWVVVGQVKLESWIIESFEWCHDPEITKGLFF